MKRKRQPLQFQDHAAASQCRRRAAELCSVAAKAAEIRPVKCLAPIFDRAFTPSAAPPTTRTASPPHAANAAREHKEPPAALKTP